MKQHGLPIFLIVTLSLALYSNTLKNGFVYDDEFTIVNNTLIKKIDDLKLLLDRKEYFLRSGESTYRPVVTFTYFLDCALYGLNPWGYHLTNILLHVVNSSLLYILLSFIFREGGNNRRIIRPIPLNPSFLITLLFVAHPALSEAVNCISYREDLLAFLFYISALVLFLKSRSASDFRLSIIFMFTSYLSYILALLSKEMAITFILTASYVHFHAKNKAKCPPINRLSIGYLIITILYLYLRFFLFSSPLKTDTPMWPLIERLTTIPWLLINYVKLSLFPFSLSADYAVPPVKSALSASFLFPLAIIVYTIILIIRTKANEISLGIIFFLISLLPVYNLAPITNPFADRYIYLPMAGLITAVGLTIHRIPQKLKINAHKLIVLGLFSAVMALYSISTIDRNKVWVDDLSLWTDTIGKNTTSSRAYYNLGNIYLKSGNYQLAIEKFTSAIANEKGPIIADVYFNRGLAYFNMGIYSNAINDYTKVLEIDSYPRTAEAYYNRGLSYSSSGNYIEAIKDYTKAISIKPIFADAFQNRGTAYENLGDTNDALIDYSKAIELNPSLANAYYNRSIIYANSGNIEDAFGDLQKVITLNPQDEEAYRMMGTLA